MNDREGERQREWDTLLNTLNGWRGANSSLFTTITRQEAGASWLFKRRGRGEEAGPSARSPRSARGGVSQSTSATHPRPPEAPPISIGRMLSLCMRERVLLTTSTNSSQLSIGGGYGRRGELWEGKGTTVIRGSFVENNVCVAYGARGVEISHSGAAGGSILEEIGKVRGENREEAAATRAVATVAMGGVRGDHSYVNAYELSGLSLE